MSRSIRMLAAATTAGGVALLGLTTAGAASATVQPGTTGPGSWFFDQGDGNNAITTTTSQPTTSYTATVQQPINAPGQIPSVFSNKTRTIPVKYQVNKCTTPDASMAHFPGTLESDLNGSGIGSYGNLSVTAPAGTTVGNVSNLTANFQWAQGTNAAGSMRWALHTPDGEVWIYYGEPFNTGNGTVDSGTNMITDPTNTARVEVQNDTTNNEYDTLANVLNRQAPAGPYVGTVANEPVSEIDLVVDSGFAGTEQVDLSGVSVTANGVADTYTPGDTSSGGGSTACAPDTTDNFWISLTKLSGNAPPAPVDETTLNDTQGDAGGLLRSVGGGTYMYNLPMSQLDPTAQYKVGISPNSDGSSPIPSSLVQFGIK